MRIPGLPLLTLLTFTVACPSRTGAIKVGGVETGLIVDDSGLGPDRDGDGFPAGEDCDDADAAINPAADEICDGIDNNCDEIVDGPESVDASTWYDDADGDNWGNPDESRTDCIQPDGTVDNNEDCDDTDAAFHPGALEEDCTDPNDYNCDGSVGFVDADGDGFAACEECDDTLGSVNPVATEVCDGIDNNCNQLVDDGDPTLDTNTATSWYIDGDSDGFGNPDTAVLACANPDEHISLGGDCDDENALTNPGAPEICDGADNDCDGTIPAVETIDNDTDGFPACNDCDDTSAQSFPGATELCDGFDNDCDGTIPTDELTDDDNDGFAACDDCDDSSAQSFPGAPELCDGTDNDCDGSVLADESDLDGDSWRACEDCDDTDPAINPDAVEVCDGVDNDCDGLFTPGELTDDDGDGFASCDDCDDTDFTKNPGASEQCNGEDDDCDGVIDNGVDLDADGDGISACAGDCDDNNASIYPGSTEICNYLDDDCDGNADDGFKTGAVYTLDTDCGSCGNDCSTYNFDNASAFCGTTTSIPECTYTCLTGFFDVNGSDSDGCECQYLSPIDDPFDGIDADCDGTDGNHGLAVHVSILTGSISGTGTASDPLDSIQDGIDLAVQDGYAYVLVAYGTYDEGLLLEEGISLFGGYSTDFTIRDAGLYTTKIQQTGTTATHPGTVTAIGIGSSTLFDGFEITSQSQFGASQSAIGLWLEDCDSSLVITGNIITAGVGRAGQDGISGVDGSNGGNGANGFTGTLTNCSSLTNGGLGGINTCDGIAVDGGDGGDTSCPTAYSYQDGGTDGAPNSTGGGGGAGACDGLISSQLDCEECYIDSCWNNGQDGGDGTAGLDGSAGSGSNGNSGSISAGQWVSGNGTPGSQGTHGGGGGGGGAGSGTEVDGCGTGHHLGGTGAGGGAGGCAGTAGGGGTGGGGSIGILFYSTTGSTDLPVIQDNTITASDGGVGGYGGDGGLGGLGGLDGTGGSRANSSAWCAQAGGDGGRGGDGGGGGGGGGGAGGVSLSVLALGTTPDPAWTNATNLLSYGNSGAGGGGGSGGRGGTNDGSPGLNGLAASQSW